MYILSRENKCCLSGYLYKNNSDNIYININNFI